jgi:glutaredoxin
MTDVDNERAVKGKAATVYRMVMDKHVCPWGLKTVHLLKSQGYAVDDHHLSTREETDVHVEARRQNNTSDIHRG